jgi:flagellar hook-length control protein FliK
VSNAIQSVLGMVKSLLPLGNGDTLSLTPKLPDFSAFLDNMMSMLQGILGSGAPASVPPAPEVPPPPPLPSGSGILTTIPPAPNPSSAALLKSGTANPNAGNPNPANSASPTAQRPQDVASPTVASAALSAQLHQIRKMVEQIQNGASNGNLAQAGASRQAMSDLAQALAELKKQVLSAGQTPGSPAPEAPGVTPGPSGPAPSLAQALAAPPPSGPGLQVLAAGSKSAGGDALSLPPPQNPAFGSPASAPPAQGALSFGSALDAANVTPQSAAASGLAAAPPVPGAPLLTGAATEAVFSPELPSEVRSDGAVAGGAQDRSALDRPAAPPSGSAEGPSSEDRAELVEQIVKAARLTQSRGSARIKLDLNPPNLGTLKMDLSVRQHVLHGTLQADNAAARDMLLSHLPSLKQSLEDQGIHVGDFQVQVDQSFQQAMNEGSGGRAPQPDAGPAKAGPEEASPQAPSAVRSARIQMIDFVA